MTHPAFPRPTIGFMAANIHVGASRTLWPGVLAAAETGSANLFCFPGGRLQTPEKFEAERNLIYELIDPDRFDGLISWTSTLSGTVAPEDVIAFQSRFRPLPIVNMASAVMHGSSVTIDGYSGMRALVNHLIQTHDYRKIAIIRGPEGHPYALERYRAYVATLKENGIEPNEALISSPVSWEHGADAMRELLDVRGLAIGRDVDAVVASSDLLAIGALGMMSERGIHVPTDVAVVGFNDIEEGRLVRPPLTSVSLPFFEQGHRAVETLLGVLSGDTEEEQVKLASRLLVRQSCGCPSPSMRSASAELSPSDCSLRVASQRAQAAVVDQIGQVIVSRGLAVTWAKQLVDTLRSEVAGTPTGRFRTTLDGMLQQGVLDGDETTAWQAAITVLRQELLPALDGDARARAEGLLGQARVLIGEAVQRSQIARQLQAERQNSVLRELGQALITTFDIEKLTDVLAERLPELGIASCYLALYEAPAEGAPIEWARLMMAYSQHGRVALPPDGRRFAARELVPADLMPQRRWSMLVEPLYFQTEPIGFVVFEIGPLDGEVYEVLSGHISSALKGALLFREAHEARVSAERADQIKTRLLANVSHELRTPLNIIIGHTQRMLVTPPNGLQKDLEHIQGSAEHQLRIINDLLDLSRAEIQALDLYPARLQPLTLIEDAFAALAKDAEATGDVAWRLALPDSLPEIEADPVRLRQILLNLLSNAKRFTEAGEITLGAEATDDALHFWVADSGIGVPAELKEAIFAPFFTREEIDRRSAGIGLGLSITRHLVALHDGYMRLESEPGRGSTFHVYLPLPEEADDTRPRSASDASMLWLITNAAEASAEIDDFCAAQGLALQLVAPSDDLDAWLKTGVPAVVAWDLEEADADDWAMIRRLQNHPDLAQTPFMLVQRVDGSAQAPGLTSLVVKPVGSQALWDAIRPSAPPRQSGSVLIIDDDARARQAAVDAVANGLPAYAIRTADDGEEGLASMLAAPPDLVVLDLMMPKMDGFEVLARMRQEGVTRQIPVVILSARQLSLEDVGRLEQYSAVTLQSKGILTEDELIASFNRSLFETDTLPPQTGALAKRAIAFMHQNYVRPISRREIADGIGVSEDYLTRVFNRELGLSPWDYLNRYRVFRAKELLRATNESVALVGQRVGFSDPAYFSRVFRRTTGQSPSKYRKRATA